MAPETGVLWFDAHADFNTPATSPSGFLDGMSLAIMTGRCMTAQTAAIPGFAPLQDRSIAMMGVRDIDDGEKQALARVALPANAAELREALDRMNVGSLHVHLDLDALDPSVLVANHFAAANGLSLEMLKDCLAAASDRCRIASVAITACDPAADERNAGPAIVSDILQHVVRLVPPNARPVPDPS
jgi:arginase